MAELSPAAATWQPQPASPPADGAAVISCAASTSELAGGGCSSSSTTAATCRHIKGAFSGIQVAHKWLLQVAYCADNLASAGCRLVRHRDILYESGNKFAPPSPWDGSRRERSRGTRVHRRATSARRRGSKEMAMQGKMITACSCISLVPHRPDDAQAEQKAQQLVAPLPEDLLVAAGTTVFT